MIEKFSIATEKFYVVIENGREMRGAKASWSRQGIKRCNKKFSQKQGLKKIMLRHGKSLSQQRVQSQQYKATQLCRDKEKVCRDNKSMLLGETLSRQRESLSRQNLRITTKRMLQHSRDCCNKVEELRRKFMSRQKNYVTTKSNYVAIESKKIGGKYVAIGNYRP